MKWMAIGLMLGSLALAARAETLNIVSTYSQAEAYIRARNWDEGIRMLRPLLAADPQNLKALNLLGIALTGKGELKNGNQQFEHVLKVSPNFLPSLKNLGVNEFTLGEISDAEFHLRHALKFAPEDPVINAYLGDIAYGRQQYRDAAIHLEKAGPLLVQDQNVASHLAVSFLEMKQNEKAAAVLEHIEAERLSESSRLRTAVALAQNGQFQAAIPYFERLVQASPDSYDLTFDLAVCLVESKRFSEAIDTLRQLAAHGHNTSEVQNLLGEAYEENNQIKEAIASLREATVLAPQEEENYLDLAALCINQDAFDVAGDVINVGLHYHPKSSRLIFQRGLLHAMQNQFDPAEKDFQLAGQLAPDKNFSYLGLGVSYIQTGHLEDAIRLLRRRTRQKPNDYMLQYLLGQALVRSGTSGDNANSVEAESALQKSVHLNSEFALAQVELAKLLLKQNRVEDAAQYLEKARILDPKNQTVYSQLAVAYRRQGKPDAAKEMLTKLSALNEEERSDSHGKVRIVKVEPSEAQPANEQSQSPQ